MTFRQNVRLLRRDRTAFASLIFLLLLLIVAVLAPLIAPFDPTTQDLRNTLAAPSWDHLMGTDQLGRDVLSKMLFGTRTVFLAGFVALIIPLFIGVPLGMFSGYFGRAFDNIVMRIVDGIQAFPGILLALAVTGVLGIGLTNTMIAISVMMTPDFVRLARAQTKQVRTTPYIHASRLTGAGTMWILGRHVWPNIFSPILIQASFAFGIAILVESALSFLGLGAQSPEMSWGTVLKEAYIVIYTSPLMILFPAIAISAVVLASNRLGDGLRTVLDPRLRESR